MKPPLIRQTQELRLTSIIGAVPPPLRPAISNGATVLVSVNLIRVLMRLVSNLVLTRLLAPDAFGVIGVVVSVSYILIMMSDMGFVAYVIRHEREDSRFLSVVWTIRLIRSVLLTAVMVLSAGLFAGAFGKPELSLVIAVAAFTFLFEGLMSMAPLVAMRHARVVRVMLIELLEAVTQLAVVIIAALILRSYWAIIIGMYWSGVARLVSSYVFFPRVDLKPSLDREVTLDLWRFARVIMPSSIITIILTQTDKIFMARYFPLPELGVFMLASTIVQIASQIIEQYSERIIYPAATAATREGRVKTEQRSILYGSKRRLFAVFAFGIGGMMTGGELIIRVLFDERYLGAALYVSALTIAPLLKLSTAPAMFFLVARGYVKATLYGNVCRLAFLVICAPLGFTLLGPIGVVLAVAAMDLPVLLFNWWKLEGFGAFSLREELLLFGAAACGALVGYGVNTLALTLMARGILPSF